MSMRTRQGLGASSMAARARSTPVRMMMLEVAPGASSGGNPHTHGGEEVGLLLSGELDYWVDGVHYRLQPGDCVSFDSSVSHRYSNPGNVPAVCVWTETPRGF
ncbi:cupin domain-containing protein [Streptomyces sp. NPDC006706]|uniref:cupin domain-containing protein n=1 Tax=Streptomyces sp. NPDC006706 TaxID=3364761 RepID=UPI0036B85BD8